MWKRQKDREKTGQLLRRSGNSPFFRWGMKAAKHMRLLYKLFLLFVP